MAEGAKRVERDAADVEPSKRPRGLGRLLAEEEEEDGELILDEDSSDVVPAAPLSGPAGTLDLQSTIAGCQQLLEQLRLLEPAQQALLGDLPQQVENLLGELRQACHHCIVFLGNSSTGDALDRCFGLS